MPPPNIFTTANHFNHFCDTNKVIDFLKTKYIIRFIYKNYFFHGYQISLVASSFKNKVKLANKKSLINLS